MLYFLPFLYPTSPIKGLLRQLVWRFSQAWLRIGISPAQRVESYSFTFQINLTSDQAMLPVSIHFENTAKHKYRSCLACPAKIHHKSPRLGLQIKSPFLGKWSSRRCRFYLLLHPLPVSFYISIRSSGKLLYVRMLEPGPHLRLPAPIIVLNAGLETSLPGHNKNRYYPQAQAQPHHATDRVLMMMSSLEPRIVIKLRICWQPNLLPMFNQRRHARLGAHHFHRPRNGKAPVKRNTIQYINMGAPTNNQPLYDIKAIEFRHSLRHRRQIPSTWRRRPANTSFSIQCTAALKNTADGADTGNFSNTSITQLPVDSLCSIFTEIAVPSQLLSNSQYHVFHGARCARNLFSNREVISPAYTIKTTPFATLYPVLDARQAAAVLPGYRPLRRTMSYLTDHCSPSVSFSIFLFTFTSLKRSFFIMLLLSSDLEALSVE